MALWMGMAAMGEGQTPGATNAHSFATNATGVVTQGPEPEEDIRDIRGVVHIAYPWMWMVYAAAAAAAAVLAAWAWRAWKNRPVVKVKLPHELALERLDQALLVMTPDKTREFSIAVSDAVRFYIEDRFHAHAARRTTEEFLHDLVADTSSPLAAYSGLLEDFLRHCDLAKFARWSLSAPEMRSMLESARRFVMETRPRDESRKGKRPSNAPDGFPSGSAPSTGRGSIPAAADNSRGNAAAGVP